MERVLDRAGLEKRAARAASSDEDGDSTAVLRPAPRFQVMPAAGMKAGSAHN